MIEAGLPRELGLTELHVHVGSAVDPAVMWSIAHAQGIRLPTKNYWDFVDLITAGERVKSFDQYLALLQRTKADFAKQMKERVDVYFPRAQKIHVVLDHLNTHTPGAFYEAFEPAEAKRLVERLVFHDTPKHASWLNVAELELALLTRQCLRRRIPDREALAREIGAWQKPRNDRGAMAWWRFTVEEARVKLHHLYPS